jgi:hypothetical protein
MKTLVIVATGLLGLFAAWALVGQLGETDAVQAQATGSLPQSLDKLYPPSADGPMWLVAMLQMGTSFAGMVTDFTEGDFTNAEQGYADFQLQYGELSQMVPEWASDFLPEPIDALGAALESRDPDKFMSAVDDVAKVCHACHVKNMTWVQQKHHWGDFGDITLTDPVSKGDVSFTTFMRMLDGDLAGVQVDLAQGQVDQAREHAMGLAARYETLTDACGACHDSERSYYVDSSIIGMIDKLGAALGGATADPGSVQELVQGIGMESCHECHLVHGPAALARYISDPAKH